MSGWQKSSRHRAKHPFGAILVVLSLSIASCSLVYNGALSVPQSVEATKDLFGPGGEGHLHGGEWHWITLPPASFISPTGTKETVMAASGERLEARWRVDWIGSGKIFPHWYYELRYFGTDCIPSRCTGVQVGKCHFSQGCNFIKYYSVDENGDGTPDRFLMTSWQSWDFGGDEGVEGFLDQVEHRYDPLTGRHGTMKRLYRYPSACEPPVSSPPYVCDLKEECKPPYEIVKEEVVQNLP